MGNEMRKITYLKNAYKTLSDYESNARRRIIEANTFPEFGRVFVFDMEKGILYFGELRRKWRFVTESFHPLEGFFGEIKKIHTTNKHINSVRSGLRMSILLLSIFRFSR
jgi:hypothetical protein